MLATTPEKERELSGHMTPIITETNKRAAFTKQLLQRLREETERMKTASGARDQNELRIRENLINTLTRKFVDVMKEYQNAQQKFKMDIKKKMKRQVQIVHPDATPAEVEEVISSGGVSGEIIKNVILKVYAYFLSYSRHALSHMFHFICIVFDIHIYLTQSLALFHSICYLLYRDRLQILYEMQRKTWRINTKTCYG